MRDETAGRALDALIAEKVFGLVPCQGEVHRDGALLPCHAHPDSPDRGGETRSYSTDIAAAWLVVEKLEPAGWWLKLVRKQYHTMEGCGDGWEADFRDVTGDHSHHDVWGTAATPALAICLAALKAAAKPPRVTAVSGSTASPGSTPSAHPDGER